MSVITHIFKTYKKHSVRVKQTTTCLLYICVFLLMHVHVFLHIYCVFLWTPSIFPHMFIFNTPSPPSVLTVLFSPGSCNDPSSPEQGFWFHTTYFILFSLWVSQLLSQTYIQSERTHQQTLVESHHVGHLCPSGTTVMCLLQAWVWPRETPYKMYLQMTSRPHWYWYTFLACFLITKEQMHLCFLYSVWVEKESGMCPSGRPDGG